MASKKVNESPVKRPLRAFLVALGALAAAIIIAGILTAISSPTPEERAACKDIEANQYAVLKDWLEQPENWMPALDLAQLEWSEREAIADQIAESHGCPEPDGVMAAIDTYLSTNDFETIWPAGCEYTEAGYNERTAVVLPAAQAFVNAHPDLTSGDRDSGVFDDGVDSILVSVGCEPLLADDVHDADARYTVETVVASLLSERERVADEAATAVVEGSSEQTWDVNVDIPDLNPFYCSWSIRGGFNCGVH